MNPRKSTLGGFLALLFASSTIAGPVLAVGLKMVAQPGTPMKAAEQTVIFTRSQEIRFENSEAAAIRFESDARCTLSLDCWDKRQAFFTWTVESVASANSTRIHVTEPPAGLRVEAKKRNGSIVIEVIADRTRFRELRGPTPDDNPSGFTLLDSETGLLWRVKVVAQLPCGAGIDTTRFSGAISFPKGMSPGSAPHDEREAPGLRINPGAAGIPSVAPPLRTQAPRAPNR